MRTIKFRGKSVDYGTWRYGSLIIHEDGSMAITGGANEFSSQLWSSQVHPESVGQWTGKFDINGIEIYKGDIVNSGHLKSDEWIPSIAVIEWDDEFSMFYQSLKGINKGLTQLMDTPCEIIGNIIDSPELMEVKW